MRARLAIAACAFFMTSCGEENAIVELTVTTPSYAGAETLYVVLEVRSAREYDFGSPWGTDEPVSLPLGATRITETISVVALPAEFDDDLLVRARFCASPRCDAIGDDLAGERRLRVETPFYSLQRTEVAWDLPAVETTVVEEPDLVERCEVRGCREGFTSMYCDSRDGRHFCD